jgi:hypothetical protein
MDLSIHSLQNRWRHSITVLVFLMMPTQMKTNKQLMRNSTTNCINFYTKNSVQSIFKQHWEEAQLWYQDKWDTASPSVCLEDRQRCTCTKRNRYESWEHSKKFHYTFSLLRSRSEAPRGQCILTHQCAPTTLQKTPHAYSLCLILWTSLSKLSFCPPT